MPRGLELALMWMVLQVRQHRRSFAALVLLTTLTSAVVMVAAAGARRGDSALQRLTERTLPATVFVQADRPGFDWDALRSYPEVAALSTFAISSFEMEGIPSGYTVWYPPGDDELLRRIERPVILAGRLSDPGRADEVVVTPGFVSGTHRGVGDTVIARLLTPEQVTQRDETGTSPKPAGPRVPLHVVGVILTPYFSTGPGGGVLIPSPAMLERYRPNLLSEKTGTIEAMVRLRGGQAAIPDLRAHLADPSIDVDDLADRIHTRERGTAFESWFLLGAAAAAALAGLVLVGQAVLRQAIAAVPDLVALRGSGLTPGQALGLGAVGPTCAVATGAVLGAVFAVAGSRWFPIGSAAAAEPDPGVRPDLLVLGVVVALVPMMAAVGAAVAIRSASTAARRPGRSRRSVIAGSLARSVVGVPVAEGARFALEAGATRSQLPVRVTFLATILGTTGLVAAMTFAAGATEAAGNPHRFGRVDDLLGYVGLQNKDFTDVARLLPVISSADPDIIGVLATRVGLVAAKHATDGEQTRTSLTVFSYETAGRPLPITLTAGRMPATESEVVLAVGSARTLGARPGDTIRMGGDLQERPMTVTGLGFVPESSNVYIFGAWVTPGGYQAVAAGFREHVMAVSVRQGASITAVADRLEAAASRAGAEGLTFEVDDDTPQQLDGIRQVDVLPIILGLFLGAIAVAAVGHALVSGVRTHSKELAILRTLGMTPRQAVLVLMTQAFVLTTIGLTFGIPLGVAGGRTLWRVVANYTPLQYAAPISVLTLMLVVPVALALAGIMAAAPARRASRQQLAMALRVD